MQATLSSSASPIAPPPPPDTSRLLVADGSDPVRGACGRVASDMGFTVLEASSADAARAIFRRGTPGLLLLDLEIPGGGMALLEEIRRLHPATRVLVTTEFATVQTAIDCMRRGVQDYLPKPFTVDELAAVLARAGQRRDVDNESRALRERLHTPAGMGEVIGRSPEMEKLFRILAKVAFTHHPVLLLGESGTGKELFARSIHFNGSRSTTPFLLVDCAAAAPDALDRELFGSAASGTRGILAAPDGASVFLDEVADLTPELQARLLRALQDREVRPLGATDAHPLSARLLASSRRNLSLLVDQGRFRKDLFYRLNVVALKLPALRERADDIPVLAQHFLNRLERETGASLSLSPETLALLGTYDWPGNVRELETAMERACALNSGPVLQLGDLPTQLQEFRRQRAAESSTTATPLAQTSTSTARPAPPTAQPAAPPAAKPATSGDLTLTSGGTILTMADIERQVIVRTLRQLGGDKLTAARLLGIGKTTLYRKLKEYGIDDTDPV